MTIDFKNSIENNCHKLYIYLYIFFLRREQIISLLPLYLLHITDEPHTESELQLWGIFVCNLFLVVTGIIFMYKLYKQKEIKKTAITFGVALLINYVLILIFGSVFDLLG